MGICNQRNPVGIVLSARKQNCSDETIDLRKQTVYFSLLLCTNFYMNSTSDNRRKNSEKARRRTKQRKKFSFQQCSIFVLT